MTLDGYLIPLDIMNGLPYIKLRPYTDGEWKKLPMVVLTSDEEWDPKVLDYTHSDKDNWCDDIKTLEQNPHANLFDEFGEYKRVHDPFSVNTNNIVF